MMRVGIVTLPFHFNYGGILQAFALQKAIQNLGFEPIIIEQPSNCLLYTSPSPRD